MGEASPLLHSAWQQQSQPEHPSLALSGSSTTGQATVWQTVLNIMKTCMGTGCLALAVACHQSGVVVFVTGMIAIGTWNFVCMHRLLSCLALLPPLEPQPPEDSCAKEAAFTKGVPDVYRIGETTSTTTAIAKGFVGDDNDKNSEKQDDALRLLHHPPTGTSTLGRVAWYAFGRTGLQILDVMVVLLLLGIVIAYVAAVLTFVNDTPLKSSSRIVDAIVTGIVMGSLSLVPDVGYLSGASAIGLIVLLSAFVVIAGYGVWMSDGELWDVDAVHYNEPTVLSLQFWPSSLNGISRWFGIVVFGYGVVPLTFNFQESMKEPAKMMEASASALVYVAVLYVIMGVGMYWLFPNLTSDVLHELPSTGILPTLTRYAIMLTVLTTAPLLVIPCAELIEGKVGFTQLMPLHRNVVRFSVVGITVLVAVILPDFVQVLSFVGCFCVALVSFCVPPTLHLRLSYLQTINKNAGSLLPHEWNMATIVSDVALIVWGVIATIVSTVCTLQN